MKKIVRKIVCKLPPSVVDFYDMIFVSAAKNQMRVACAEEKKFRSYTQLKRYQKKLRRAVGVFFLAVVLVFVGMVLAPVVTPQAIKPVVHIPNGKGDVLLANITRNQATIVFKTLDAANGNKPLATTAFVEAFEDQEYKKLVNKTNSDEYAVTHIIPISGLSESRTYYIRITAADSSNAPSVKTLTSWGDGKDPIKVLAVGEMTPACTPTQSAVSNVREDGKNEQTTTPVADSLRDGNQSDSEVAQKKQDGTLQIQDVQSENHIFAQSKVQTIISWITNTPASTALVYREGKTDQEQQLVVGNEQQTKHGAVLTTLKPGTTYYFKVKSENNRGELAVSEEYSLLTPQPSTTVVQKIGISFMSLMREIKPEK